MTRITSLTLVFLLAACAPLPEKDMYTAEDFSRLRFLEGRWIGTGPDGSEFHEQYSFPATTEMRSSRFPDASFTQPTDGSVVAWVDGQVVSRWGEFEWKAIDISDGRACFEPINAPSSFCWERVSEDLVHVTQQWTDDKGVHQKYVIPLRRAPLGEATRKNRTL